MTPSLFTKEELRAHCPHWYDYPILLAGWSARILCWLIGFWMVKEVLFRPTGFLTALFGGVTVLWLVMLIELIFSPETSQYTRLWQSVSRWRQNIKARRGEGWTAILHMCAGRVAKVMQPNYGRHCACDECVKNAPERPYLEVDMRTGGVVISTRDRHVTDRYPALVWSYWAWLFGWPEFRWQLGPRRSQFIRLTAEEAFAMFETLENAWRASPTTPKNWILAVRDQAAKGAKARALLDEAMLKISEMHDLFYSTGSRLVEAKRPRETPKGRELCHMVLDIGISLLQFLDKIEWNSWNQERHELDQLEARAEAQRNSAGQRATTKAVKKLQAITADLGHLATSFDISGLVTAARQLLTVENPTAPAILKSLAEVYKEIFVALTDGRGITDRLPVSTRELRDALRLVLNADILIASCCSDQSRHTMASLDLDTLDEFEAELKRPSRSTVHEDE